LRPEARPDFGAIYDRHFRDVYAYVAYRLGGRTAAVEDLVEEVFLAALKGLPRFRPERPVLTWLRAIARNKVADHFRSAGRSHAPLPDGDPEADAQLASPARERAARVSAAMQALPPHYVALLEEKYLDGLSVRQMAGRRGVNPKAVESALARARGAFRDALQRQEARVEAGQ
jgi:RNA polymerase sigma-70 factor (ECF subfamily)